MRIAQIAPIVESVPPKKYGGTERVVHALTEQLVKLGHDVTLFASGDSQTSAKLVSIYPKSLKEANLKDPYGANIFSVLNVGQAYDLQNSFDIIHDHNGYTSLAAANIAKAPVVMTYHGPITPEVKYIHEVLNKPFLVSISRSQSKPFPTLNWAGTVYNGLEMKDYPFSAQNEGYLLFVGRISREKGVHNAIEVAKRLNLPLIIAAKLENKYKPDMDYFRKFVKPHLSDKIKWVGEVDEQQRNKFMSNALAFLHPITWAEPFGLTLIESMACGCPVVAFGLGSIPEVIENEKTGFVVNTIDEMVQAVQKVAQINRRYCREYALKNFSARNMTEGYLKIYEKVIAQKQLRNRKINTPILREFSQVFAQDIKREIKQTSNRPWLTLKKD
jgi:glycosyltransferase involved in cell wall biosynthesis